VRVIKKRCFFFKTHSSRGYSTLQHVTESSRRILAETKRKKMRLTQSLLLSLTGSRWNIAAHHVFII